MSILQPWLNRMPLVAILRGICPEEAVDIAAAIIDRGLCLLEVPLNSPQALRSIEAIAARYSTEAFIGAGTVMTARDVHEVVQAGGKYIVMPHSDPEVIAAARSLGAACVPGVATPNEAFAALKAGAAGLKLFPAEALPPPVVRAWRAVLPPGVCLLPVGGITPETMAAYRSAGATGFGIGSALYRPGISACEVGERAAAFVEAWSALEEGSPTLSSPAGAER